MCVASWLGRLHQLDEVLPAVETTWQLANVYLHSRMWCQERGLQASTAASVYEMPVNEHLAATAQAAAFAWKLLQRLGCSAA